MRRDEGKDGTGTNDAGATGGDAPPVSPPAQTTPPVPTAADLSKSLATANESLATSRREVHALRQMLGAHNVPAELDASRLASLTIGADGSVSGDYGYKPPVPKAPTAPAATPTSASQTANGLTKEMLATMSHGEINKRWDDVKAVLSA